MYRISNNEDLSYAIAISAAEGLRVEWQGIMLGACPQCAGTGLIASRRPLPSRNPQLADAPFGVESCRQCCGIGYYTFTPVAIEVPRAKRIEGGKSRQQEEARRGIPNHE